MIEEKAMISFEKLNIYGAVEYFCSWVLVLVCAISDVTAVDIFDQRAVRPLDGDLSYRCFFPQGHQGRFTVTGGIITVKDGQKAEWSEIGGQTSLYAFDQVELSFSASADGACEVELEVRYDNGDTINKKLPICGVEYKPYSIKLQGVAYSKVEKIGGIRFVAASSGNGSTLRLKDISLNLNPPASSVEIKLQCGENFVPVKNIFVKEDGSFDRVYDKRAAYLLQRMFFDASKVLIPVKPVTAMEDASTGDIVIGQLALDCCEQLDASKITTGGYTIISKDAKVFVFGKGAGVETAVIRLFEKFAGGIFVTEDEMEPPLDSKKPLQLPEYSATENPEFELRLVEYGGLRLGYTDTDVFANGRWLQPDAMYKMQMHTIGGLLPFGVYGEAHPEYYALQADGTRLSPQKQSHVLDGFGVHVCMSNRNVQEIVTRNLLAWMSANQEAEYFPVNFGDFSDRACRCDHCRDLQGGNGRIADRNLKFVNIIAEETKKRYPGKKLLTAAYLDTELPPLTVDRLSDNIRILYCPYVKNWHNCYSFSSNGNRLGIDILNQWVEKFPGQIYIFDYPSNCPIRMRVWPGFYATCDRLKYYAKLKIKGLYFCGLSPEVGGLPAANSFNPLTRYVCSKILWDSQADVEGTVDEFLALYYGPAAQYMKEYLELVHADAAERNLTCDTEQCQRNFMSKELADKCFKIFEKAEGSIANNSRFFKRVQKEKLYLLFSDLNDRSLPGREGIEREKFIKHLAEFITLMREFRYSRIGYRGVTPMQWFRWITGIQLNGDWLHNPIVDQITATSADVLDSPVFTEEVTPCISRWEFINKDIAGGEDWKEYAGKKNLKCLRYNYNSQIEVNFKLPQGKTGNNSYFISMEILSDNPTSRIEVGLNDKSIYQDPEQVDNNWRKIKIAMPKNEIKEGINQFKIKCISGPWVMVGNIELAEYW